MNRFFRVFTVLITASALLGQTVYSAATVQCGCQPDSQGAFFTSCDCGSAPPTSSDCPSKSPSKCPHCTQRLHSQTSGKTEAGDDNLESHCCRCGQHPAVPARRIPETDQDHGLAVAYWEPRIDAELTLSTVLASTAFESPPPLPGFRQLIFCVWLN